MAGDVTITTQNGSVIDWPLGAVVAPQPSVAQSNPTGQLATVAQINALLALATQTAQQAQSGAVSSSASAAQAAAADLDAQAQAASATSSATTAVTAAQQAIAAAQETEGAIALAPGTATNNLTGYFLGVIVANQPILQAVTPQPLTLPQGLSGSYAYADTAPAEDIVCPIMLSSGNVATQIGTVNFAANEATGTFTFPNEVTTNAGDIIEVFAPATIDPFFYGPSFGITGTQVVAAGFVVTKVAGYTPNAIDRKAKIVMNAPGAVTNVMPAGTGTSGAFPNGWECNFLNIGASPCTIAVPAGSHLNGVLNGTINLNQGVGAKVFTDGTDWFLQIGS